MMRIDSNLLSDNVKIEANYITIKNNNKGVLVNILFPYGYDNIDLLIDYYLYTVALSVGNVLGNGTCTYKIDQNTSTIIIELLDPKDVNYALANTFNLLQNKQFITDIVDSPESIKDYAVSVMPHVAAEKYGFGILSLDGIIFKDIIDNSERIMLDSLSNLPLIQDKLTKLQELITEKNAIVLIEGEEVSLTLDVSESAIEQEINNKLLLDINSPIFKENSDINILEFTFTDEIDYKNRYIMISLFVYYIKSVYGDINISTYNSDKLNFKIFLKNNTPDENLFHNIFYNIKQNKHFAMFMSYFKIYLKKELNKLNTIEGITEVLTHDTPIYGIEYIKELKITQNEMANWVKENILAHT